MAIPVDANGGWTAERISEGLGQWVRTRVGRDDIRFEFDPSIESMVKNFCEDALAELDDKSEKI